ncbi:hypothetical protein [Pseudomonas tohonis]|uniref:hypothetical protein n=1 Tax=Pseudomonas tohonis TaxID=2725477 RepID=UPI0015644EE6|nr:hypothetical protein [Pseudomonas tohonis]
MTTKNAPNLHTDLFAKIQLTFHVNIPILDLSVHLPRQAEGFPESAQREQIEYR